MSNCNQLNVPQDNINVVDDFKDYIANLEQQDLVALVTNLIDDEDGLSIKQMRTIMKQSGVEGYK